MRLKVKRELKSGGYFVSFKSMGFSPEEIKKIKKWGMPIVDFSADELGVHRLDKIDFSIQCKSAEEAEEMTNRIKQNVKNKVAELFAQADYFTFGQMVKVYTRRIALVFGILSVIAVLVLLAYHGVISSQKIAQLGKRIFATVSHKKISSTPPKGQVAFSETKKSPQLAQTTSLKKEFKQSETKGKPSEGSLEKPKSGSLTFEKPDFILSVVPDTLIRYHDWDSSLGDQTGAEQFKLILMTVGGFEGPVNLEVSGSCYLVDRYLYPTQIETLPGSATLVISLLPKCPHQVCSDLTVIAKGITSNGDLVSHQRNLVLAIREKPNYSGKVWHVSPYGDDLLGHGSQSAPFRTIQKGIDCAQAGDTVLVKRGIYKENINLIGKNKTLITSHFIFDHDETTVKSTIIEACQTGWVVTVGRSDEVTLQGFTIRKGKGNDGSQGGGIYCYDSNPNLLDNIIIKNINQSGYGAGIYCYHSKPHIRHNQIIQNYNRNGHGSGIYCYNSDPDIQDNIISGNGSSGGGSAIHLLYPSSVRIIRNLIYGDSGSSAVLLYSTASSGEFQIINNTISHNQGDAIRFFGGPWFFRNNIITHNNGYGLFTFDGTAQLTYNDVWGNVEGNISGKDAMPYFSSVEDPTKNNGNISKDPCFGNPAHGNFHLSFNSPCIDFGAPDHPGSSEGASRIDMGAIEYTHPDIVCGDANRDGFIDFGDINYLLNFLSRKGSPPDPFKIGDVNCDGKVDHHDISYLYSFLYYYGPEPCANCK